MSPKSVTETEPYESRGPSHPRRQAIYSIGLRSIWKVGPETGTPTTQLRKGIKAKLKWSTRTPRAGGEGRPQGRLDRD